MKNHRLHVFVWVLLRLVLRPFLILRFNYSYEKYRTEGPCLILASHDTNWDPLFLGCAFPKQMYFVASEHIFRWGFVSWIINTLLAPISRLKGTTAGDTAMTILRRLKKGYNVAMFANGSRSFNGKSEDILPSTGKLARASGATLITYRFDGGYFTEPRWNFSGLRRGKISGRVMGVYPPEELKKMSAAQISEIIDRDLFVDAYAVQRQQMIPFRGKRPAEHLETVLTVCPKCGAPGSLKSENDRFFCTCGYEVRYNEYGFLTGPDAVYDSVTDWDEAQTVRLKAMADEAGEDCIFSDSGFELFSVGADHSSRSEGKGDIALYRDRFECCGLSFPLSGMGGFALHGPTVVNFSSGGVSYELKPDGICCTRKYMTVIDHLRETQNAISTAKEG